MITAAIPTFNNASILWLQLESLCRQVDAPEWELIVCEEFSDNYFGKEQLAEYTERLKAANCSRIVYVKLDTWCALGQKWLIIRELMSKESVGMMLCASDNYSPKDRIKLSYEAMLTGADWSQFQQGYFYNILNHSAGLFSGLDGNPALFMCVSSEALKRVVSFKFPRKGVDTWLMRGAKAENVINLGMAEGCHTDGYNTLSMGRRLLYEGSASGTFEIADADKVFSTFPKDIQNRLIKMRL
jgi:hypothetical protein